MRRPPLVRRTNPGTDLAQSMPAPAPVGGLNARDAEAAMRPHFARFMVNFWPEERFVGIRKGWQAHKTGFAKAIRHTFAWRGPTSQKLFAVTDDGVFDATTAGAVGAVAKALTSGKVITTNFNVSGGSYVFGVNATDDLWYYNGTTFTSVATYTIGAGPSTIATNKFSYVAPHQRALFFIEKDSMNFYYLPINQISGAINLFPLGGLFKAGGKLVAMGSWTVDGGDGQNDLAVFVTSEGQAAIYLGTDPSDASKWALQGVYTVGKPLGHRPLVNIGGDLAIMTTFGLVSMSQVLKAGTVNEKTTYTGQVAALYRQYARAYESAEGWEAIVNPHLSMLVLNIPNTTTLGKTQLAMNMVTGAWTEFNGWDAKAWELFGQNLYAGFGTTLGKTWTETDDNGARIQAVVQLAWNFLKPRTARKTLKLIRFFIRLGGQIRLWGAVDSDFETGLDWQPIVTVDEDLSRFDTDLWNSAQWATLPAMDLDWLTLPCGDSYVLAPRLRVFAGDATFEWSAVDYAYTAGTVL